MIYIYEYILYLRKHTHIGTQEEHTITFHKHAHAHANIHTHTLSCGTPTPRDNTVFHHLETSYFHVVLLLFLSQALTFHKDAYCLLIRHFTLHVFPTCKRYYNVVTSPFLVMTLQHFLPHLPVFSSLIFLSTAHSI